MIRVGCALCAIVLLCSAVCAAEPAWPPGKPRKSTTGAVLRSLVIPGWGQLYTKSYYKAAAFAGLQGSLIYSAVVQNRRMFRAKRAGDSLSEHFYRESRNKLLWWIAGITLLSMGDAYVEAQLYGLDFSPSLEVAQNSVQLSLVCNF